MWNFDGSLFSGPFSQLFVVLGQIGWRVEPPFLVDHDQCHLNLLGIDDSVLIPVLWDAWLQYVARQVVSRKTMQGLQVLDPHLLESASKNLTSLEQALMGALQSGPSWTRLLRGYDMTNDGLCSLCEVPDTNQHWLGCPRFASVQATMECWQDHHSLDTRAGEVVAMGHVLGLSQSSDRAELLVALSAIELQVHFGINMHLRRDSKFVANGLSFILQSGATGEWSNQDLWERIHQLLQQLGQFEVVPHWIPSHLDATKLKDPFEDWVRCWNDQIDFAVGQYNFCRAHEFLQLRDDTHTHFEMGAARLRQLQAFYFKVAANRPEEPSEPPEQGEVSLFGFVDELQPSFGDLYNSEASDLVCNSDCWPSDLPAGFVLTLINDLAANVDETSGVLSVVFWGNVNLVD